MNDRIKEILISLYGKNRGEKTYSELCEIIEKAQKTLGARDTGAKSVFPLDQRDSVIITYGDQFLCEGEKPLKTLHRFLSEYVKGIISGVHILPFFPYSSDDGFSIIDYTKVNPSWGGWQQIKAIAGKFNLMCDLVLNHISSKSVWFKEFLKNNPGYADYFITVPAQTDLSLVARPRALPLVHSFSIGGAEKLVWTTFSEDQIDLNFQNPRVLLEMIEILLFYLTQGARLIRLDAIAYVWKELGTSCIHLPQVYLLVELFRLVIRTVAPGVLLITETNVPHKENVSYLGDGSNGAHMVYQFSLPPLVLHSFKNGDAGALTQWADGLTLRAENCTFFNFLASHDGVGILPVHGILSPDEIQDLVRFVEKQGGRISYKDTEQGPIPYELNISYLSAVTGKHDPPDLKARKFLASQAIMLAFKGVPGIYIHSLLGSTNYYEGVEKTGINRTINREKLDFERIEKELKQNRNLRSYVYRGFVSLMSARSSHPAFHPLAQQRVIKAHKQLFIVIRRTLDNSEQVVCVHNVAACKVNLDCAARILGLTPGLPLRDIISGKLFTRKQIWMKNTLSLQVNPYHVLWLVQEKAD
ncbi:MAG: sugar phosphorylase [Spirochaetales bacterium]|nr:sugar phosphorylase [Spirochaetales bacterium]